MASSKSSCSAAWNIFASSSTRTFGTSALGTWRVSLISTSFWGTGFWTVCGTMPCRVLYSLWMALLLSVSATAARIDPVMLSAYSTTRELTFRAALPMIWTRLRVSPEEALLVGVQNPDEPHLRDIEPFPQEVDPDEDIKLPEAELPDDLGPLEGVDLRVEVPRPDPLLREVVRELLCQFLGEGRQEDPVAAFDGPADLPDDILDLPPGPADEDLRVDEPGGPDDLLHDLLGAGEFPVTGCRGDEDHPAHELLELPEHERAVVVSTREPEP